MCCNEQSHNAFTSFTLLYTQINTRLISGSPFACWINLDHLISLILCIFIINKPEG